MTVAKSGTDGKWLTRQRRHTFWLNYAIVDQSGSLVCIFSLPVLINSGQHAHQPVVVFDLFQQIRRGKKLDTVGRRIAQRLEQPGGDQYRDVMRPAVEHPGRLLRRQASGQLPQQPAKIDVVPLSCHSSRKFEIR